MDPGADPSECEALCANRPACVAWSFVTCGDRLCWLKFQVGTPREHSCRVSNYIGFYQSIDSPSYMQASGLKSPAVEYGIDRSGSDISGMPIRLDCGADASDCALLCAKRADCLSWAANICESEMICWLKNGVPGRSDHTCRVSYIYHYSIKGL